MGFLSANVNREAVRTPRIAYSTSLFEGSRQNIPAMELAHDVVSSVVVLCSLLAT
jgi:hypothetical protein